MRYQLVLQWPLSSIKDFDHLIEIEEHILRELNGDSEIDGHDIGAGEANIFIFTNDPVRSFEEVREILGNEAVWNDVRAAYCDVAGSEYNILWPEGCSSFRIR